MELARTDAVSMTKEVRPAVTMLCCAHRQPEVLLYSPTSVGGMLSTSLKYRAGYTQGFNNIGCTPPTSVGGDTINAV